MDEVCGSMVVGEVPEGVMTGGLGNDEEDIICVVDAGVIVVLGTGQADLLTCEQISGFLSV